MSELWSMEELRRQAEAEREHLRMFLATRLEAGVPLVAIVLGTTALLGNMAVMTAAPGRLDELIANLGREVRANANASLDHRATSGAGHA